MKTLYFTAFVLMLLLFINCESDVQNQKDLDENMLDMMMYHDNLGLYLRKKDSDYSLWLLNNMDSSLQLINEKFTSHRKLSYPFEKYYNKLLAPPINDMRRALEKNNFETAIKSYRLLTKNCNSCHINHDVDKTVTDRSNSVYDD